MLARASSPVEATFDMAWSKSANFFTAIPTPTAATVPGKPAVAYSALFGFYALMLGITVIIYLFSQDARPEGVQKSGIRLRRR